MQACVNAGTGGNRRRSAMSAVMAIVMVAAVPLAGGAATPSASAATVTCRVDPTWGQGVICSPYRLGGSWTLQWANGTRTTWWADATTGCQISYGGMPGSSFYRLTVRFRDGTYKFATGYTAWWGGTLTLAVTSPPR